MAIFEDGFYAVKNGDMYKITLPEPVFKGAKTIKLQLRPETNAERIRSMTDEELAVLLSNTEANFPPNCQNGVSVKLCETAWLDWLRQEAKDEQEP